MDTYLENADMLPNMEGPSPTWFQWWRVKTPPICSPVTLQEVKTFARLDAVDEDNIIQMFLDAATLGAQEYMGRSIIQQKIEARMDYWPGLIALIPRYLAISALPIPLMRPPLVQVTNVYTYFEDDTIIENWPLDQYYWNRGEMSEFCIRKGSVPPINVERYRKGFGIEYIAGYSNGSYTLETDPDKLRSYVPAPIKLGILMWTAMMYSQRGRSDAGDPPPEAKAHFQNYKVVRI